MPADRRKFATFAALGAAACIKATNCLGPRVQNGNIRREIPPGARTKHLITLHTSRLPSIIAPRDPRDPRMSASQ